MIPAILAGTAALIFMLILFSVQEQKEQQLRRRINRMLIRRPTQKQSLFSFMGTTKNNIDKLVDELFPDLDPDMVIIYALYIFCGILALSGILGNIILGLAINAVLIVSLFIYLDSRRSRIHFKLEQQFGAFARDVATYLRANPSLFRALEETTKHVDKPLKTYLESAVMKVEAGEALDTVLREFAQEVKIESAVSWVNSIIFARMAKSNLTDVCDYTADRINRKLVRSMNIRATLSKTKGMIMAILGITVLMIVINIAGNPETRDLYFTEAGQYVLGYVVISLFITSYLLFKKVDGIAKK